MELCDGTRTGCSKTGTISKPTISTRISIIRRQQCTSTTKRKSRLSQCQSIGFTQSHKQQPKCQCECYRYTIRTKSHTTRCSFRTECRTSIRRREQQFISGPGPPTSFTATISGIDATVCDSHEWLRSNGIRTRAALSTTTSTSSTTNANWCWRRRRRRWSSR